MGKYPIGAVQVMARIIETTEEDGLQRMAVTSRPTTKSGAVTWAAAEIGDIVHAKFMITFTQRGEAARRMSRSRTPDPDARLHARAGHAFLPRPGVGMETFITPRVTHTDEYAYQVDQILLREKRVEEGDLVVIVAGSPPGIPGSTNAVRVHRIGDAIHGRTQAYADLG